MKFLSTFDHVIEHIVDNNCLFYPVSILAMVGFFILSGI